MEDKNRKQKVKDIIDEINLAIIAQDKQIKQKTIKEILSDERWANRSHRKIKFIMVQGTIESNSRII